MRKITWVLASAIVLLGAALLFAPVAEARGGKGSGGRRTRNRVSNRSGRAGTSRGDRTRRTTRRRRGTRARPSTSAAAGRSGPRTATQRRPRRPLTPAANRTRIGRQLRLARSPKVRFREKTTKMVDGKLVTVTRTTQPGGPTPYRSGSRTRQLRSVMSNREILAAENVRETVRAAEARRKLKGKMPAEPRPGR